MDIYVFKLLITVLTLAVSLPGIVENDYKSATLSLVVFFLSRIVGNYDEGKFLFPGVQIVIMAERLFAVIGSGICFYYLASISLYPNMPLVFTEGVYASVLVVISAVYVVIDLALFFIDNYKKYTTYKETKRFAEGRRRS